MCVWWVALAWGETTSGSVASLSPNKIPTAGFHAMAFSCLRNMCTFVLDSRVLRSLCGCLRYMCTFVLDSRVLRSLWRVPDSVRKLSYGSLREGGGPSSGENLTFGMRRCRLKSRHLSALVGHPFVYIWPMTQADHHRSKPDPFLSVATLGAATKEACRSASQHSLTSILSILSILWQVFLAFSDKHSVTS